MFPTQFTGASFTWERKKFSKIVQRISTTNSNKSLPNIEFEDIDSEIGTLNKSTSQLYKRKKGILFEKNNILFGKLRPYLKKWFLTDFSGIAVGDFWVLKPSDNQARFVYYLIQTNSFYNVSNITSGTKMPRSDWTLVSKTKFYIPMKLSEKHKLGMILYSIDKLINLHEDYLQFLHDFKSFLLQKMFFDNDIPPLLRFNKFIEKWNQCRLNDHAIVTMGQSPNSKNYTNNQTDKILVQGNADLYKNKVLKRVFTTEITKTAIKNDILISVRAPVGDIARNQYESVVIGRGIASIKGNDFLYYQLEKMKNSGFWNKYIAGSTFESITGKDLKNAKIYTTNSDEERKIGNIFSSLTNIIQLQEHKIDSLKKLKQFLLQNMFI